MMTDSRQDLAASLRTALKTLPASLRPKEADIGAMAELIAQHPCMARWKADGKGFDFRDMKTG